MKRMVFCLLALSLSGCGGLSLGGQESTVSQIAPKWMCSTTSNRGVTHTLVVLGKAVPGDNTKHIPSSVKISLGIGGREELFRVVPRITSGNHAGDVVSGYEYVAPNFKITFSVSSPGSWAATMGGQLQYNNGLRIVFPNVYCGVAP